MPAGCVPDAVVDGPAVKAPKRDADWLPPRTGREPPWAAHGAAVLERRFQGLAVVMVLTILVAVACLFTGQVVAMVLGPALAVTGGYVGFAAERRLRAARRTGWRDATVTLDRVATLGTSGTVAVTFADGSRIDLRPLRAGPAVKALSELPGLPAIIAGHGPAMTVLVPPNPPLRERPVLFPARAATYRWRP